ncbi:NAD(P)/FAD-dependent oxidoreductase [Roseomonas sp. SSH11]|uniref:NAD(P)/FAD-dependent oxidoreductase n=1 Tax=Pararoseomonas baculiformis TaxID=2820812 RepID=A0ABS4AKS1_9PROT|nr:FAD-dependent oxidoreductase [Pararoseomonas baculiformis]MBP0447643.1 NAD(P)/FAD-dependent oxidoreductase [Pararoseomonas baculiformis]
MRILVVGAGPAGTRCALRIAGRLPRAQVVLAGAEPALPYDRVALSKYLIGEMAQEALVTHSLAALRAAGVSYRPATPIAALDLAAREAITARGERIAYDRCVLATGSRAVRLPLPGAELPGVIPWRDLAESRSMIQAAREGGPAVVIGGGLLGLEAAAGLAARGMKVTVLHAVGWPMERQLDPEAGALLAGRLRMRGLNIRMPVATAAIEGRERAQAVLLKDGTRIPARLVVMAVGVRPNSDLARASGLDVGRGIVADAAMRTSDPHVLAVGECAEVEGRLIGLVAPALEQAEIAAATIAGEAVAWAPRADSAGLKVSGTQVWSGGEVSPADAEAVTLRAGETYRRLWWRGQRLVGAVLYGDTAEAGFYQDLIASGRAVASRAGAALGQAFLKDAA